MDPAELRRRNFIPPDAFPYETPTGSTYDSGDYRAALEKALEAIGYDGWRAEQERRRGSGEGAPLGIGICSFVEGAGMLEEYGAVEVETDGNFLALSGTSSTGQSHETTFAQVVASALEVDVGRVRLVQADTGAVPRGVGSFGSRSMQVGGSALYRAALAVVDEARHRMAERCGVAVEEVGYLKGTLRAGAEALTLAELVDQTGPLRAEDVFVAPTAFPYGCYVAVVEVDPDLGNVRVLRMVAVDDCGVVINPMVVEGQAYGSIAQGIGQALYEQMPYDAEGQPLARSLLDYLLPTLSEMPPLQLEEMHTPNPNTPLGAKGVGESGCIGTPPAIVNAVADALDLDDTQELQMPLTPEVCWTASRSRTGSEREERPLRGIQKGSS
jgi:carbon-monoxide dehydrogenase large subunit